MKYPLNIYVLWHPNNYQGLSYAKTIFSTFSRDVNYPLQRGIGIPTYFISDPENLMQKINCDEANQTCILFFMDEHMIIDDDDEFPKWEKEVLKVYDYCTNHKNKILFYPIATDENASRFSTKLNVNNRLNLYEFKEEDREHELLQQIAFKLSTRLYPLLYNERELPVTVFISHARRDGDTLALMVKNAIDQLKFGLTPFIDVKDIGKGENFEDEISTAITESIFLILNTDEYSSREWCIKEIIYAKKNSCPIIHVNAAKDRTKRVFPYLGNFPSIKLKVSSNGNSNIDEIIATVLLETLRYKYHKILNEEILSKFKKGQNPFYKASALPPELLTIDKNITQQLLLYPDPPLGNEEISILKEQEPNIEYITPLLHLTQIHSSKEFDKNFLKDRIIGLSISENPELVKNRTYNLFDHIHLQDALVEISRYLLVSNASCAYGGNIEYPIKKFNFTEILTNLTASYIDGYNDKIPPIINHVFYPISEKVKNNYALRSRYKGVIDFKFHINPLHKNFSSEDRPEVAIALTDMRKKMFLQNEAQIFIAGKVIGYEGMISGILEEAYWALKYQRPIYIVGAFGGISAELINLLVDGHSTIIQNDSSANFENSSWQEEYTTYCAYALQLWKEDKETVDNRTYYEPLGQFFANHWKQNESNLNNGLSKEENHTLFSSKNMLEVTRLILKGLNNFFNHKKTK
jgi:hypothetical protein